MCRKACGIPLPDTDHIVITGGQQTPNKRAAVNRVQIYNISGKVSSPELPSLKQGRFQHACAYYYDDLGQLVSIIQDMVPVSLVVR